MTTYKIISLRIVTAPATGIVSTPHPCSWPAITLWIMPADGSTILLHAEEDRVRGFPDPLHEVRKL